MSVPEVQTGLRRLGFIEPASAAVTDDADGDSLEPWIERQYRTPRGDAAEHLAARHRQDPARASVRPSARRRARSSPRRCSAPTIPDPDYFFHWYRDSAVVIDALRLLLAEGQRRRQAPRHLRRLRALQPRARAARWPRARGRRAGWRAARRAGFRAVSAHRRGARRVHGEAVAAETRVNPDGTLDISNWARPQHDGPALRALACCAGCAALLSRPS